MPESQPQPLSPVVGSIGMVLIAATVLFVLHDSSKIPFWTLALFAVSAALFLFWIATLVSCLTNESSTGNDKIAWAMVIVFLNVLGAALYWFIRRPQRIRELGR